MAKDLLNKDEEFSIEQLLGKWQRHFLHQIEIHQTKVHTFGVVSGFAIVADSEKKHFIVEPGTAITEQGLLLVKPTRVFIRPSIFDELRRDRLRVFLVVDEEQESKSEAVRIDHLDIEVIERQDLVDGIPLGEIVRGFDSVSATEKGRERAGLRSTQILSSDEKVKLELGNSGEANSTHVLRLNLQNEKKGSFDTLLQVESSQQEGETDPNQIRLDSNLRVKGAVAVHGGALQFAGLVSGVKFDFEGEAGKLETALQAMSADPALNGQEDNEQAETIRKVVAEVSSLIEQREFVQRLGEIVNSLRDLELPESSLRTNRDNALTSLAKIQLHLEKNPRPWHVYRSQEISAGAGVESANGDAASLPSSNGESTKEQLRVELPRKPASAFEVGSSDPEGLFKSILTVEIEKPSLKPKVTIHGDLHVQGAIQGKRAAPEPPDPTQQILSGALVGPQNIETLVNAFKRVGFRKGIHELLGENQIEDAVQRLFEEKTAEFTKFLVAKLRNGDPSNTLLDAIVAQRHGLIAAAITRSLKDAGHEAALTGLVKAILDSGVTDGVSALAAAIRETFPREGGDSDLRAMLAAFVEIQAFQTAWQQASPSVKTRDQVEACCDQILNTALGRSELADALKKKTPDELRSMLASLTEEENYRAAILAEFQTHFAESTGEYASELLGKEPEEERIKWAAALAGELIKAINDLDELPEELFDVGDFSTLADALGHMIPEGAFDASFVPEATNLMLKLFDSLENISALVSQEENRIDFVVQACVNAYPDNDEETNVETLADEILALNENWAKALGQRLIGGPP